MRDEELLIVDRRRTRGDPCGRPPHIQRLCRISNEATVDASEGASEHRRTVHICRPCSILLRLYVLFQRRQVPIRDLSGPTGVLPSLVSFGAEPTHSLLARAFCTVSLTYATPSRLEAMRELSFFPDNASQHCFHLEQNKFTQS